MTAQYVILAINPGANSTKLAVYQEKTVVAEAKLEHSQEELAEFSQIIDQLPYRKGLIINWLDEMGIKLTEIHAIVARGGIISPVAGGTYHINELMVKDLREEKNGSHASNLSGLIGAELAEQYGIPAYTVDPVVVDELEPVARLSGLKEIWRVSKGHALNSKAVSRSLAAEKSVKYQELRLITVHLGSGITVAVHRQGRMIDMSNAVSGGPFAVERCGSLPVEELVQLCYSGKYTLKQMMDKLYRTGGVYSYLGIKDMRQVLTMAKDGHEEAALVVEAMVYQLAKEIGAMATVLEGKVDYIILTGSMCYSQELVDMILQRINWIGEVVVMPGEKELEALALGALRVLTGEEEAQQYGVIKEYGGKVV